MSNHDSFGLFCISIKERMESRYDCSVQMDELLLEQTDYSQVGFQRDDLYRFMLLIPDEEEWVPSKLYAYLPEEIDQIADRPGVPVVEIEPVSVDEVLKRVDENSPEYDGVFVYDE